MAIRCPNGLLSVASLLDKDGYDIKIVDQRIDHDWQNTLLKHLKTNPVCFGVTCSTGRQIANAITACKIVKEFNKDIPVVWGGPHATLLPEQTLEHPLVDIVVLREGDITFHELVIALKNRKDLAGVRGIAYKKGSAVKKNAERDFIDLDKLPFLPYHLIDIKKYSSVNFRNKPSLDVSTSRGCPFHCAFCYNYFFNKQRWRAFSVERSLEEIKYVVDTFNIKDLYFVDDNFSANIPRAKGIMEGMKKEGLDILWGTQGVRIDTLARMEESVIELFDQTGCMEMSIGVETGSQRMMELITKGITIPQVLDVNRKIKDRRFKIKYNFIIGFPTETVPEMHQTIQLALQLYKENNKAWFPFNVFAPYPGSLLYDLAIKEGFTPPDKLEDWVHLEPTGWQEYYKSWFPDDVSLFMRNVNFASYFAFRSVKQKITNPLLRVLFDVYHPIAHYRFEHMAYAMPVERKVAEFFEKARVS